MQIGFYGIGLEGDRQYCIAKQYEMSLKSRNGSLYGKHADWVSKLPDPVHGSEIFPT